MFSAKNYTAGLTSTLQAAFSSFTDPDLISIFDSAIKTFIKSNFK